MKSLCPICKRTVEWEGNRNRPFCSERCKLIDLGQWASGAYRIPSPPEEKEAEEETDEGEDSSDGAGGGKNGRPAS